VATAVSTYTWAEYKTDIKSYLGISGDDEDTELTVWLTAAAEDFDDFTNNTFVDDAGEDITHPTKVWLGIAEWVRAARERHQWTVSSGIKSVRTGALSESYGDRTQAIALARAAAYPWWVTYVTDVSTLG